MYISSQSQIRFANLLDELRAGDPTARDRLIGAAQTQIVRIVRMMLGDFSRLRSYAETNDIAQEASLRLWQALSTVTPSSVPAFLGFIRVKSQQVLIDLVRKYFGPHGDGTKQTPLVTQSDSSSSLAADPIASLSNDPFRIAQWNEFLEAISQLSDNEQVILDLKFMREMTIDELARELGVAPGHMKRKWIELKRDLAGRLKGHMPCPLD